MEFLLEILSKMIIAICSAIITTLLGILLSKIIKKVNNGRIYRYARTLVEAAEQKFPNEGTKMGPQKEEYVMSQLVIKFPRIRDSRYLYNIVLKCVYELNREIQTERLEKEFKEKYGDTDVVNSTESVDNCEEIKQEELPKPQRVRKHPSSF